MIDYNAGETRSQNASDFVHGRAETNDSASSRRWEQFDSVRKVDG